jgi:hypothetical protein
MPAHSIGSESPRSRQPGLNRSISLSFQSLRHFFIARSRWKAAERVSKTS